MSRIEDGGAVEAGLEKTDQLFNPLRDRNERWLMLLRPDWVKVKVGDVQDALQGADILTEYTSALRAEITRLRAENAGMRAENAGMRDALEEVAEPIAAIQKRAKEVGAIVDGGTAVYLSNDAGYLKGIARAALSKASQAEGQRL